MQFNKDTLIKAINTGLTKNDESRIRSAQADQQ